MTRRKRFVIVSLIIVTTLGIVFAYSPGYDLMRVHPRLRALQPPYRSIETVFYSDGGSIGITLIDCNGRIEQFASPAYLGDPDPHSKLFVGTLHAMHPGAIEITDPGQTRLMLIHILQQYPRRVTRDDFALMQLSRRPIDISRCLIHRWHGRSHRD